ncbi:MAG: polysaccharide lyase family 1 protein [Nannocystaceae bacterium]|nr:hypothetical protein [bacterium]
MKRRGIECRFIAGVIVSVLAGACTQSESSGATCETDECSTGGPSDSGATGSGTAMASTGNGAENGPGTNTTVGPTAGTTTTSASDETSGVDTDPKTNTDDSPLLAFPGAVGFGRDTVGGRGGQVVHVTSLDDSGPGTLREALALEGPRTIIFRVSGTIALDSTIRIEHSNVTIAGQSAPGGGIALRHSGVSGFGTPLIDVTASEVIIRHLRLRRGPSAEGECCGDAMTLLGSQNVVIDHCSMSWSTDETFNTWPASWVTIQDSIFSEALREASHEEEGEIQSHALSMLLGNGSREFTLHRNLFAHNTGRNPAIGGQGGQFQITNNVIYNTCYSASLNGENPDELTEYNAIGNSIIAGANECGGGRNSLLIGDQYGRVYVEDNLTPYRGPGDDEWMATALFLQDPPAPAEFQADAPFDMPQYPVAAAADLLDDMLPGVGATLPMRDSVDARVIQDVLDNTGSIIDDPSEVGGWPDLSGGTPYPDEDVDGMDDRWETSVGLDPADGADGALDLDGDGYTNLEEFLNGTNT